MDESEPALQPLLLVGQFSPRPREAAPGQNGFELDEFNVVGCRFRVDYPGDEKMLFLVTRIYGGPFAQKQFLGIQLVKVRFRHDASTFGLMLALGKRILAKCTKSAGHILGSAANAFFASWHGGFRWPR